MRLLTCRTSWIALACVALAACGARTRLDPGQEPDAGATPDAGGPDAGRPDAGPPDAGVPELTVDCGRAERFTTPRRAITVEATVSAPSPVVSQAWRLAGVPMGAAPAFDMGMPPSAATLTPDLEGAYELVFEARDAAGGEASCAVTVQAVVGPPVAICPEAPVRAVVGTPAVVMGDGFDDDAVVSYLWDLIGLPPGSDVTFGPADAPVTELVTTTPGSYVLRLTVVDIDMATDSCEVEVIVTGPPEVTCPASPVSALTRQPVELRASARDDVGLASVEWAVASRPPRSAAEPQPRDAEVTRLTPDRAGTYALRFTAVDVEGLSASCEVTVEAAPTPPTVTCPARLTTTPLTAVGVSASAEDDGTVVRWSWALTSQPMGSAAARPSPADAPMTSFTPDVAGVYEITVTATDDDGMQGTCTTRVEAGNVDGLRVEMSWDTPRTDMDLHLLNPASGGWGSSGMGNTCYYANCVSRGGPGRLEWGAPGPDDNPRLDIDDTDGFGPENINILRPEPGTYRVGVHAFRGRGAVTVRVYCGGSTTVPRRTYGPVMLDSRGGSGSADLWRVVDVTVSAAGCTLTDLTDPAGGPDVRAPFRTEQTRR